MDERSHAGFCEKKVSSGQPIPADSLTVVVVKWDRFSAVLIAEMVTQVLAGANVRLFHRAEDALNLLKKQSVDLGIFGLTLPDRDGLDLLAQVAAERLAKRRIVVTWRTDERVQHVLKGLGIDGLLETMRDEPDRLVTVLRQIMMGAKQRQPSWQPRDLATPALHQLLSERELQVLAVLADGTDDQTASEVLGLRPSTVHTHRQRIMSKLGIQTRAELIREAMRRGVIRFIDTDAVYPGMERLLGRNGEQAG